MFTNEFEFDATVTTVLDESGTYQEVELIIEDDTVYIRQFAEKDNQPADLIEMTPKMFYDMLEALNQTEGFYVTKYKRP